MFHARTPLQPRKAPGRGARVSARITAATSSEAGRVTVLGAYISSG